MHLMEIQRTSEGVILKLPADIDTIELQDLIDYLKYKEATRNSKADQEAIDRLAEESKTSWWAENKHKFIR